MAAAGKESSMYFILFFMEFISYSFTRVPNSKISFRFGTDTTPGYSEDRAWAGHQNQNQNRA